MRRKLALVFLAVVMVMAAAFGLAACGDKPAENLDEYEEFETVVKTVLNNSVNKMGEEAEAAALRATSFNVMPLAFTQEEKDDLFGIIDKYSSDAEIMEKNYVKGMFDLVTQTTMAFPLIAGDALRTYPKVSEFYGVSVGCREEGVYIRVNKDETLYTTSVYTGGGNYSESYYRMEIDYKSETEFSFMIFQDSPANAKTNMDAYKMFYYGDSEMNFLNGIFNDEGGMFAYYKSGVDYVLNSAAAAKEMYPLLSAGFENVDREEIKAIGTDTDHIVTAEQWAECYLKYMNGGEHFDGQDGQFEIKNGVLYGWIGKEEDCPSAVTLPSTVSSVYYELRFPDHVKEISIPATVQSVKVERGTLEWLESGNEGTDETLVECPVKYFTIILNTQDGSYKFLEKIDVSAQSPLFESDGNFLYSKKDGMLLYVAGADKLTSLSLDTELSDRALICLAGSDLSNLKTLTVNEQTAEAATYAVFDSTNGEIRLNTFNMNLSGDMFGGTFGGAVHSIETVNITCDNVQTEREIDFECTIGTLNIGGNGVCRIDTTSVIQKVNADFTGTLSLDSIDNGQIKNIELSDGVETFTAFSPVPMTVTLPYSLYAFKAADKYNFSDLNSLISELNWEDLLEKTELKAEVNHDGNVFYHTYRFAAMTKEEEIECKKFADFKDVYYYTAEESEYGVLYAKLSCYWGDDSIVNVPETINGYPVLEFELATHPSWGGYPPVSVENVKEVHLPASLKKFDIMNWSADEKQYALEKIVFGGTKEEFLKIINDIDFYALYSMLEYTDEIECKDGTFTQQPMRESWFFADENDNILQIDLDWSEYDTNYNVKEIQARLVYNGNEYFVHDFNRNPNLYFQFGNGETAEGEMKDYISVQFEATQYDSEINRKVIKNLQVYYSAIGDLNFTLVSTEEFTGTIEHDFSVSHTREPDCLAGGGTDWYCSVCGMFGYVTDEEPPLGHDSDEYGTCSRCGQNTYFDFDSYIDDYGQEAYALVRVKEDCKTAAELRVPEEVNSVPVRKINYGAFAGCYELERVYLPSTLVFYEADAFRDCSNLREVHIDNVAAWFGIAFENREASPLNTGAALYYGGGKITDLVIPDGVTKIGDYTLANCDLNSITIPESVVAIGDYAFQGNCSIRNATVTAFAAYKIPKSSLLAVTVTGGELTDGVFYDCPVLESVVLANGIQAISNYAFQNSAMLTSIDIPESVTSIGYEAFSGCAGLTQITLPSGLREIVSSLFYGCTGLEQVVIPEGVARIGQQAFYGCSGLTSITFPASVTAVDNMAFGGCDNLQKVCIDDLAAWCNIEFTDGESNPLFKAQYLYLKGEKAEYIEIPDGVEQIKQLAFFGYKNLRGVVIPDSVTEIDSSSFEDCSNLKSVETPAFAISYIPTSSLKTVAITSGEELPWGAFRAAAFLTSVSLSDSVTKIGREAFSGCSSLEAIELPGLLTDIEYCAFENCTSLVSVTIPNSVTQIDQYAFRGCSNLQSVSLPAIAAVCFTEHELLSVTITGGEKIPANAFQNCTSLETLVLKEGIETIGSYAFAGCTSLERISIPASVTFMEAYVFNDCTGLKEVVFAAETRLEYGRGFEGCMNIESATCFADMMYYLPQDSLQTANIIGGSTISNDTFYNATHLREIHISDGIREIGARAFSGCVNLSSLEIPDSVTSIGEHAFSNCGVKELILSSAVESVGYACFADSIALESVIFEEGASISVLEKTLFMGCVNLRRLVLPQISDGIEPDALVDCTKLEELSVPFVGQNADGTGATNLGYLFGDETDNYSTVPSSLKKVCVSGSYPIPDEAFDSCRFIEEVILSTEIRQIGANAFASCVSLAVISFGENSALQTIGVGAFTGCYDLVAVVIPSGVYQLGEAAFMNCRELKTVVFEANDLLQTIERMTFAGCSGLTGIAIPASVTQLGVSAFSGCSVLESINIPQGVTKLLDNVFAGCGFRTLTFGADCAITEIGEFAFMGCSRLESVRFSEGSKVRSIGKNAFSECDLLNTVELPEGLITLGESVFSHCRALKSVSFGKESALESLGMSAFYDCISLTEIHIPEKITEISRRTFYGCSALVSVEFSENLTKIGGHAFYMCKGLTNVVLPESLVAIEGMAFFGCSGLRQISIPESVTSIGSGAFQGSGLTDVVLGGSGTTIAANAFSVCTALQNVTFRDGTTSINGFSACNNLKNIIIPASVTAIADYAFTDSGLTIGDSVNIFYDGTSEQWNSVEIGTENDILDVAIVYYYSDTPPEDDGNYWHYAKDNVTPIIWVKGEGIYSV